MPNVQFHGAFYAFFVALFVADIGVAMVDVAVEPASRRSQGGLPAGEYMMQGRGVEFSTSYMYEVRWGAFGRWFDRAVFRPLFQRATERSFRRLEERYFPEGASRVAGARGRKPVHFLGFGGEPAG
ncbi:hypothetical protein WMF26_23560 [Sorangium sp. So ce185]|uniref:hypothetical protein n=1 Tax=Sorangium sp. So ce185 TaxID=3133287 RepID=UPI003F602554